MSTLLDAVTAASVKENKAVKPATMPSRAIMLCTKNRMMTEAMGRTQAITVVIRSAVWISLLSDTRTYESSSCEVDGGVAFSGSCREGIGD